MPKPLADTLTPSQREALVVLRANGEAWTSTRTVPGTRLIASGSAKALVRLGLARWKGWEGCSSILPTPEGLALAAALEPSGPEDYEVAD